MVFSVVMYWCESWTIKKAEHCRIDAFKLWCEKAPMHANSLQSCLPLCNPTPWTLARQAPLFMGFSRQEYWSGLPCPTPGHLPNPGIEPASLIPPALAGRFFTTGGFPGGSDGKASTNNVGDPGSTPGSGRFPGEGYSNPLQYSCLENPMDGGAW